MSDLGRETEIRLININSMFQHGNISMTFYSNRTKKILTQDTLVKPSGRRVTEKAGMSQLVALDAI